MFRHTAACGLIECRNGSCGAPTSTAMASRAPSGVASAITTSTIETPMLPAARVRRPAARSIDSSIRVVVVLPLVPVTTSQGAAPCARRNRQASSSSPQTGTPAPCAAAMIADSGESPGETTSRSTPSGRVSPSPSRTVAPRTSRTCARSCCRGPSPASTALTRAPSASSASAAANPAMPMPATATWIPLQSESRRRSSIISAPTPRRTAPVRPPRRAPGSARTAPRW